MKNGHRIICIIPDHPYRITIIGGSGSGKTNALINLINEENDIDKIYLYSRDLSEPKYEYLMKNAKMHEYENINDHIILYIYFSFSDWVVIINILINNIILFMRILMITIQSEKEKN